MYFTYVVRPGEAPLGKGPQGRPFWDWCLNWQLRLGLFAQLLGLCLMSIGGLISHGKVGGLVGITTSRDTIRTSVGALLLIKSSLLMLLGACKIQGFRITGDDEGSIKYARGFRAGNKLLAQAGLIDLVASALTAISFLSEATYFEDQWQTEALHPNPMIIFGYSHRLLHALSLVLYAGAFFCLEAYHNEGVGECWAWVIASFYKTAAITEFFALVFGCFWLDLIFTTFFGAALLSAFIWAQAFESMVASGLVDMDQSALRNEFYKSRNAMAYYGPPVEDGMELVRGQQPRA